FRGRVRMGTPLVLALFSGLLILAGVAGGAATVIKSLALFGTTWMTGPGELGLIGALLARPAGVTGLAPKLYRKLRRDWGRPPRRHADVPRRAGHRGHAGRRRRPGRDPHRGRRHQGRGLG